MGSSIWLGHILSQADHRLSYVQPWAEKRLSTLSICTGQSVRAKDLCDDRLFLWGHSKNKRPDLAQVKIMLATLNPLALPVATEVLSGEKADDPLYIPAIQRVRETLMTRGLLYIGDCKMAAKATRGELAAVGDYYLCPLPSTQLATGELLSYRPPVWSGTS